MFNAQLIGNPVKTAVSGDGNTILVGGTGGVIGTFAPNGSSRWVYQTQENITGIAVSRDGRFTAASTYEGDLYYFDSDGNLLWNVSGFGCNSRVALSDDGQSGYVFSDGQRGDLTRDTVFHFNRNGTILSHMSVPFISKEAMSSDGSIGVIGTWGSYGNNYVVGVDTAGIRWEKKIPQEWGISDVAISDDGNTVAAIEPGSLYVFSRSGNTLWNVSPEYLARSVAVSADGRFIAAGTQYRILFFNRSGARLRNYSLPDYVDHIRISDDGQKIAATAGNTMYYLDGNETRSWQHQLDDLPVSLSMSGEGSVIATGSYNNTFMIFDDTGAATEIDLDTISAKPFVTVRPVSTITSSGLQQGSTQMSSRPAPTSLSVGIMIMAIGITSLMGISGRNRK
jgi:WD40 repeat protein